MEQYHVDGEEWIRKANRGRLKDVRDIFESRKVDINHRDGHGCSALHASAAGGSDDVMAYLLENNIDMHAVDSCQVCAHPLFSHRLILILLLYLHLLFVLF